SASSARYAAARPSIDCGKSPPRSPSSRNTQPSRARPDGIDPLTSAGGAAALSVSWPSANWSPDTSAAWRLNADVPEPPRPVTRIVLGPDPPAAAPSAAFTASSSAARPINNGSTDMTSPPPSHRSPTYTASGCDYALRGEAQYFACGARTRGLANSATAVPRQHDPGAVRSLGTPRSG